MTKYALTGESTASVDITRKTSETILTQKIRAMMDIVFSGHNLTQVPETVSFNATLAAFKVLNFCTTFVQVSPAATEKATYEISVLPDAQQAINALNEIEKAGKAEYPCVDLVSYKVLISACLTGIGFLILASFMSKCNSNNTVKNVFSDNQQTLLSSDSENPLDNQESTDSLGL